MEGILSTFTPYNVCGSPAHGGPSGWGKGRFMTPQGLNYLELCKAILCQVHPGLPSPPLRRASTKECGVQVNAKVDKIVQCSLGPKTLFDQEVDHPESPAGSPTISPGTTGSAGRSQQYGTPVSSLRFLRPVSIYSPVFDRRLLPRTPGPDGGSEGDTTEQEVDDDEEEEDAEADHSTEGTAMQPKTQLHLSTRGSNFQFLEQRYGFFHCKKCNIRWESAYVWCISGTSKVYYRQLCRKCQVGFNPYRVEPILCKGCSQTCCSCEKKQRHINMKRPHRQDLCCRCKGMRLSCDATYSFKYIV